NNPVRGRRYSCHSAHLDARFLRSAHRLFVLSLASTRAPAVRGVPPDDARAVPLSQRCGSFGSAASQERVASGRYVLIGCQLCHLHPFPLGAASSLLAEVPLTSSA